MIPTVLCWFSCGRDYAMLVHSVAAARTVFPGAPAVVFLDPGERVLPDFPGAIIRWTDFDRGGNLQSVEAPEGVAGALLVAALEYDAFSAIKIDSDTLVLGSAWASPVVASRKACLAGWRLPTRPGLGALYAITGHALAAVTNSFDSIPPASMEEDREILGRAALWARWTGRETAMQILDADPARNTLRQYHPGTPISQPVEALHFGRIPNPAAEMARIYGQSKGG